MLSCYSRKWSRSS